MDFFFKWQQCLEDDCNQDKLLFVISSSPLTFFFQIDFKFF